jgi:polysaccharide pyruvyl transferase WcaK-like protein
MKIGILTYYGVHNHGAVLQANALKSVLEAQGHEVKFLTFDRSYEYIPAEQTKKYKISPASIGYYAKYMTQKGAGNIVYNLEKSKTLKEYRQTHFDLSTSYDQFDGDAIVIGSDEVFSLEIGYNSILYGIGLKCDKVLSYAASFGPTKIADVDRLGKRDAISEGLKSMSAISVRDQNSQSIVKELTEKDVPLVCDPVILYGYKKEMGKKHDGDYILVYAYDGRMNDADEVQKIKAFAKAHHKKLYSVGYHHKWCDRNVNVSPDQLLQSINNASFVITDTFHGSVMSIICNTPMAVKLRNNSNKLRYLISEYGLEDQIIDDFSELNRAASNKIDFVEVNQKIQERRKFSMDYLVSALGK